MSFSQRAITQDVIDHVPPRLENMLVPDEEFENRLIPIFKHCIDINYGQVPETDYDFWCVAFENDQGETIFRQDADQNEITNMKNDSDGYCKVWRSFQHAGKPHKWVVWPHSISKGWCGRIEGILP